MVLLTSHGNDLCTLVFVAPACAQRFSRETCHAMVLLTIYGNNAVCPCLCCACACTEVLSGDLSRHGATNQSWKLYRVPLSLSRLRLHRGSRGRRVAPWRH